MSLKRQTLWSMAPLVVVSAVNLVSVPLFYRYLGVEMYTLWFYVATFTSMFGFADLGMGMAVGRYIGLALGKGDQAAVREYWGTGNLAALILVSLMAISFTVLGVWLGPQWFKVAPENAGLLRACFVAGGGALAVNYYGQQWTLLLQAHLEFKGTNLLRTGFSLCSILLAIAIAWATRSPFWIVVSGLILSLGYVGCLIWFARRRINFGFCFACARWERLREMATFTGKTLANLIAGSIFASLDRLVLGRLTGAAGAADFAHYTNCANVGARLHGLGGAVMWPVFHNTSRAAGGTEKRSAAAIYDEMFNFTFGWYLLAAIATAVWHPVLLRLWLGRELAVEFEPLITPIVAAFCVAAVAHVSSAQFGPLNRMGTYLWFNIVLCLLTALGVYFGWQLGGLVGAAYGFLASRFFFIAQDLYVIRLVGARGWLAGRTWLQILIQGLIGGVFALVYLILPRDSFLLLLPAGLHLSLVSIWLLRQPARRLFKQFGRHRSASADLGTTPND